MSETKRDFSDQVLIRLETDVEGNTIEYVRCESLFANTFLQVYQSLKHQVEITSLNGGDPEFYLHRVKVKVVSIKSINHNEFELDQQCVYKKKNLDLDEYFRKTDLFSSVVLYTINFTFNQLFKKLNMDVKDWKQVSSVIVTPKFDLENSTVPESVSRNLLQWVFLEPVTIHVRKDWIFAEPSCDPTAQFDAIRFIYYLIDNYDFAKQSDKIESVSWTKDPIKTET